MLIFYSGVIQCFPAIVNHLISIFADYSDDWFIPFVGDDVVAKCSSNFKKQSCIRYSKRRKFRAKMRQNAFGGRAPPGPAGGASALPQTP